MFKLEFEIIKIENPNYKKKMRLKSKSEEKNISMLSYLWFVCKYEILEKMQKKYGDDEFTNRVLLSNFYGKKTIFISDNLKFKEGLINYL